MFNSKLKKQIEDLEDRIWQLENPCKHKLTQKVNISNKIVGFVINIEFRKFTNQYHLISRYWKIEVFNPKTKVTQIYSY